MMQRARGFTLMELLLVMVIVAILASIAYPTYIDSRRKSDRAEARALMADVASRLAPYYSDHGTYTTTLEDLSYPAGDLKTRSGRHTITVEVLTGSAITSTYQIQATPDPSADPSCSPLTLDHLGIAGPADC